LLTSQMADSNLKGPWQMTIDIRIASAYLSIGADSDFFCKKKELFYF